MNISSECECLAVRKFAAQLTSLLHRASLIVLLLHASLMQPAIAKTDIISQGDATQARTQQFILRSEHIDHNFLIEVTRPTATVSKGQKVPVVYALDGGYGVMGPAVELMAAGLKIEPAYVVAIGYENTKTGSVSPREIDLVHFRGQSTGRTFVGGGAAFEKFLLQELRPFIEGRFPVDANRSVLVGHSLGGLFTLNVLINNPKSFAGYLIADPAFQIDPSVVDKASTIASQGAARRIFIAWSSLNPPAPTRAAELAPALSGPDSTFDVRQQVFQGHSHLSSYLLLAPEGLPFLLPPLQK